MWGWRGMSWKQNNKIGNPNLGEKMNLWFSLLQVKHIVGLIGDRPAVRQLLE